MQPFEYLYPDQCIFVRLEQHGKQHWQYTLRQVLDCRQAFCRWNEVIEIIIEFFIKENDTTEGIRGTRRKWSDINFHTTHQNRISDEECRTNPYKYSQYLKSCQDFTTEHLLNGVDILKGIRPDVEEMELDVCKTVVKNLQDAFDSQRL